jgi:phospholipase D-like protein
MIRHMQQRRERQQTMNLNALKIPTDHMEGMPLKDPSCIDGSVECVFKNLEQRLIVEIRKYPVVFGCVAWLTHFDILDALASCNTVSLVVQKEDFLRPDFDGGPSKEILRQKYQHLNGIGMRTTGPSVEQWQGNKRLSITTQGFLSEYGAGLIPQLSTCSDLGSEAVRCCGNLVQKGRAAPRMHHKFLVFADIVVEEEAPKDPPAFVFEESETNSALIAGFSRGHVKPVAVWTGSFNFTQNAVLSFENAVIISDQKIAQAYTVEFEQIFALSESLDWATEYVEPEYRIGT